MSDWVWKAREGPPPPGSGLHYEPGNFGDLLKGECALQCAEHLGTRILRYIDPFAGRPTYPLSQEAAARLLTWREGHYGRALAPYVDRGLVASTARLLLDRPELRAAEILISDGDPDRALAWQREEPRTQRALHCDGYERLLELSRIEGPPGLVLIDPYDAFHRWGALKEPLRRFAETSITLVYHLNKAPRGAGHLDQYERFLKGLTSEISQDCAWLALRVPADARLPRGWHEVLIFGPRADVAAVASPLAAFARALSQALAAIGAVDAPPGLLPFDQESAP